MNTVRFARVLLTLLLTLVLAWILPQYFWKAFDVSIRPPRVSYSPVEDKFLLLRPDLKSVKYLDLKGREYTREEYERLLPFMNYRQLAAAGAMPDSLRGVKLDLKEVALNNVTVRVLPGDIGLPQIPLFPLFESQSGRLKLEMPTEFFRIGYRMEFIETSTNALNEIRSDEFTDTLLARGFVFPAAGIAGNPTTRKPFDEGYFVVDAAATIFHIKMVRGKPFCVRTGIPTGAGVRQIFVGENALREFYGVLISADNVVSLISCDGYRLITLPLSGYDARNVAMFIYGDLFFRTVTLQGEGWLQTVVMDRRYKVVDTYREEWPTRDVRTPGIWAASIFPFTVNLTSDNSAYVGFGFRSGGIPALAGIAFSLLVLFISLRVRRRSPVAHWFDVVLVACTGVFGLLATFLIPTPED
jgi:hypothetical protein